MNKKSLVTIQILDLFGSPISKAQYEVKNQRTGQVIAAGTTNSSGCIVEISRDKGTALDVYIKSMFKGSMIKVQSFVMSKDRMVVKITSPKVLLDLKTLTNQGNNGQYKRKTHIVKKGDTLFEIAQKNHTTVRALERLNKIDDPNQISIGQVIKLPVHIPASGNHSHQDKPKHKHSAQSTNKPTPSSTKTTPAPAAKRPANPTSQTKQENVLQEKVHQLYEDTKKALNEATSSASKILTVDDRSQDGGTPKANTTNICKTNPQCISSGKSELIREVNIRLAGFGGALPTDEFTELTAKCIRQFQRDYMGVQDTGKICGSLITALDEFNQKYPIQKYMQSIACPCSQFGGGVQCKGFGAGRKKQYKILGIEAPGMHRSTIWILKAAHFYLEKEKDLGVKITGISSGYRCIENNAGHNTHRIQRQTVNHMSGAALDISISDKSKLNEVREKIFIKYMNAAAIGDRANSKNKIFLESRAQGATSWVHFDITWYKDLDLTKKEYFGTTVEELINGNLIDLCRRVNPKLLNCSGSLLTKSSEIKTTNNKSNIKAFLDTIAKSEGTYDLGNNGYNVMVTGKIFNNYSDHPFTYNDKAIHVKGKLYSTASGRYQIMRANWYGEKDKPKTGLKNQLGLKDFGPESQDIAAIALLKRRNAYKLIVEGKIRTAFNTTTLNKEWASFPGAGYNQKEHKIEKILAWYKSFGGTLTD